MARWKDDNNPTFIMQENEVAGILKASVSDLIKSDAIRHTELEVLGYQIKAPHFFLEEQIVWGATAMMLNEFRVILQEIFGSKEQ